MTGGRGPRNPRAGVTLLELLLSLALMAAIGLGLASVLGLTGRASLRVTAAEATTDLLLTRHSLRDWIEAAPRTAAFEGGPEALRFEMLTDEPPFSAAYPTTVSLGRDGDGAVAIDVASDYEDAVAQRLILSPAGSLRISYFGDPTGAAAAPAWHADWPALAGPPDLVRIEYDGPEGPLPPLTAIPALEARQSEMSLSSPLPPG
ncbi:hypothetical protein [Rubellimicrobium roseum]|uniref:Prepilin-type N-terminal cleavage/methylation domain-containing protein n=1 Tax=Rubellimicrobium roseum TaxID=687525 RepID=A0A5C4N953_9RHOB|nr:hypothetical protein [Rubellimicrobium roseum]TNC71351.1 hypothetical protein FHG71_12210 [Rubellimicrobium roseum]